MEDKKKKLKQVLKTQILTFKIINKQLWLQLSFLKGSQKKKKLNKTIRLKKKLENIGW